MKIKKPVPESVQKQGYASLKLEGLHLSEKGRNLADEYFSSGMKYEDFLKKAADHARSR